MLLSGPMKDLAWDGVARLRVPPECATLVPNHTAENMLVVAALVELGVNAVVRCDPVSEQRLVTETWPNQPPDGRPVAIRRPPNAMEEGWFSGDIIQALAGADLNPPGYSLTLNDWWVVLPEGVGESAMWDLADKAQAMAWDVDSNDGGVLHAASVRAYAWLRERLRDMYKVYDDTPLREAVDRVADQPGYAWFAYGDGPEQRRDGRG